jgi:pre-mRNA-processing factor SLU7
MWECGYKCCPSGIRNSYCVGEAGKAALKASEDAIRNARVFEKKVEKMAEKGKSEDAKQVKGGVTEDEVEEYHGVRDLMMIRWSIISKIYL